VRFARTASALPVDNALPLVKAAPSAVEDVQWRAAGWAGAAVGVGVHTGLAGRATSALTFCAHLRSSLPIKRYIYRWCGRNLFWFALPLSLLPNGVMFVEIQPDGVPAAIAVTTDVRRVFCD
jgi:hypothetical protein